MAGDWHWVPDPLSAAATTATAVHFPTQGEAETWLGEEYPDLLDTGVRAVSLHEGERRVYGPMSLEPDPG